MKYLVDTCVWRDLFEDRISKSGRALGKEAADFFQKVIADKDTIIISEMIISELLTEYSIDAINLKLGFFSRSGILRKIPSLPQEHLEAKRLEKEKGLPFADCLHAVQARNNLAVVVSQDRHLLECLQGIVRTIRPSDR